MPSGAAFELREIAVAYGEGRAALSDVTLDIRAGEIVGFVGPSGAGKTTLLRLLNGSVRPTRGSVAVDGAALEQLSTAELRRARARIGTVHQGLDLVPSVRVLRNVLFGRLGRQGLLETLRWLALPPRDALLDAHALLERVGIGEKLYQRTDRLSGGEQQRVAIARALFQEPAALLADEPISSVDPARARDTLALLVALSRERGLTLALSLHNLALARELVPRLVGLRAGRVVFDRATATLADADFAALYALAPEAAEGARG